MGTLRLPTGDMPKYRVPSYQKGRVASRHSAPISTDKLARLIGTPKSPILVDVRTDDDFAADPRLIPGSLTAGNIPTLSPTWAEDLNARRLPTVASASAD